MSRSGRSTRSLVVDHGNPAAMHGAKASSCSSAETDEEVVEHLLGGLGSHSFTFGRLSGVAEVSGCTFYGAPHVEAAADALPGITPKPSPDEPEPPQPSPATDADIQGALSALDGRLARIWQALPARTTLVLFTGHADPRPMSTLGTRKAAFEQAVRHGVAPEEMVAGMRWTAQDGRLLEEEVEKTKRGLLFLCVKG
jgi:RNA exonuclease 1